MELAEFRTGVDAWLDANAAELAPPYDDHGTLDEEMAQVRYAARAAEALNTALPADVSVLAAEEAPEGFHARFSASARTYRYLVLNRVERSALEAKRSLWWPHPVDLATLQACAALLPGEHDFSAFTPEADWERRGDHLHFTVTADSFLRHMVRTLVGTMLQAGAERLAHLLEGRPRFEGGATAPPWGLYLERVEYEAG